MAVPEKSAGDGGEPVTSDAIIQIIIGTVIGGIIGGFTNWYVADRYYKRATKDLEGETNRLLYVTVTLTRALQEASLIDVTWGKLERVPRPDEVPIGITYLRPEGIRSAEAFGTPTITQGPPPPEPPRPEDQP